MGRNMDAFCKFHESPGYSTKQCQELRHQIEQLIRDGKLDRFILDKPKNQQNRGTDLGEIIRGGPYDLGTRL